MISEAPSFVLRLSKDERKVFQQNQILVRRDRIVSEKESIVGCLFGCNFEQYALSDSIAMVAVYIMAVAVVYVMR